MSFAFQLLIKLISCVNFAVYALVAPKSGVKKSFDVVDERGLNNENCWEMKGEQNEEDQPVKHKQFVKKNHINRSALKKGQCYNHVVED